MILLALVACAAARDEDARPHADHMRMEDGESLPHDVDGESLLDVAGQHREAVESFMQLLEARRTGDEAQDRAESTVDQSVHCKAFDWNCEQDRDIRRIALNIDMGARYAQDLKNRNRVLDKRVNLAKINTKQSGMRLAEARDQAEDGFYQLTRTLLDKIKVYKGSIVGIAEKNQARLAKALDIYNTLLGYQSMQFETIKESLVKGEGDLLRDKKTKVKEITAQMKQVEDMLRANIEKGHEETAAASMVAGKDIDTKKLDAEKAEDTQQKKFKKNEEQMMKDSEEAREEGNAAVDSMSTLEQDLLAHSDESLKTMDQWIGEADDTSAVNDEKIDMAQNTAFGTDGQLDQGYQMVHEGMATVELKLKEGEAAIKDMITGPDSGVLPKFEREFQAAIEDPKTGKGLMAQFKEDKVDLRTKIAAMLEEVELGRTDMSAFTDTMVGDYTTMAKSLTSQRTKYAQQAGTERGGYQTAVDKQWNEMGNLLDPVLQALDFNSGNITADQLEERARALPLVTDEKKAAEMEYKNLGKRNDVISETATAAFKGFGAKQSLMKQDLDEMDFQTVQLGQRAVMGFQNAQTAADQVAQANENALKRYKETAVAEKLKRKAQGDQYASQWYQNERSAIQFADKQAAQTLAAAQNTAKQATSRAESASKSMTDQLKNLHGQHLENQKTRDAVEELQKNQLKDLQKRADVYSQAVTATDGDFAKNLAHIQSSFTTALGEDKDAFTATVTNDLRADAGARAKNMTNWVGETQKVIGAQAADTKSTEDGITTGVANEEKVLKEIDSTKGRATMEEQTADKGLSRTLNALRAELTADKVGTIDGLENIKAGMERRERAIESLAGKSFTKLQAEQKKAFGTEKMKTGQAIADIKAATDQVFGAKQQALGQVSEEMQQVLLGLGKQTRLAEQAMAEAEGSVTKEGDAASNAAKAAHELVSSTSLVGAQSREHREQLLGQRSRALKSLVLEQTGSTDKAFEEKLAMLASGAEGKLRSILEDETLTDAEKKKAIDEYDRMTQAAVAALVKEQKAADANVMNLERLQISWGAEIDADLAAAEGVLSQEQMQWVKTSLHSKKDEKTQLTQVGGLINELLDTLDAQSDLDPEILASIRAHQRSAFSSMQGKLAEIEKEQEAAKHEMALLLRLAQSGSSPLTDAELQDLQTQLSTCVEEVGDLDGSMWRRLQAEKVSREKAAEAEKAFITSASHTSLSHLSDVAEVLSTLSRVTRQKEDTLLDKVNKLKSEIHQKVAAAMSAQNWGLSGLGYQLHGIDQKALAAVTRDELQAAQSKAVQAAEKQDAADAEADATAALAAGEEASGKLASQVAGNIDDVTAAVGRDAQATALQAAKTVKGVLAKNGEWVEGTKHDAQSSAKTLQDEFAEIERRSAERTAKLDKDDDLLVDGIGALTGKVDATERKIANLHYAVNMAMHSRQVAAATAQRAAARNLAAVTGRAGGALVEESEASLLAEQAQATSKIEAENAKVARYLQDHMM